jgi:hypothetical protein
VYLYVGALLFGALENIRQVGVYLLFTFKNSRGGFKSTHQKQYVRNYTMIEKIFKTFNMA